MTDRDEVQGNFLEMQETFRILILLVVTQVTTGMSKLIRIYMHTTVPKLNLNKTY